MSRLLPLKGDSGTGAFDQMIVAEYFSAHFNDHLSRLNGVLHGKLKAMTEAVEKEFGSAAECWAPKGGIFLWISCPTRSTSASLSNPQPRRVLFSILARNGRSARPTPATACVCFAMPSKQTIRDGVAELARVCYEQTGIPLHSGNVTRG